MKPMNLLASQYYHWNLENDGVVKPVMESLAILGARLGSTVKFVTEEPVVDYKSFAIGLGDVFLHCAALAHLLVLDLDETLPTVDFSWHSAELRDRLLELMTRYGELVDATATANSAEAVSSVLSVFMAQLISLGTEAGVDVVLSARVKLELNRMGTAEKVEA